MLGLLRILATGLLLACSACVSSQSDDVPLRQSDWVLVDDFESGLDLWTHIDVDNNTDPYVPNAQVAVIKRSRQTGNGFLLRKPAADGIVGNRKAIGFAPLPVTIEVGETYTIYTRFNVEYFPNNHSFGLANVAADEIGTKGYDAFEPMIRVTDKLESNGYKNSGTLQVLGGGDSRYADIVNPMTEAAALPLVPGEWYEVWYVVNNSESDIGGQTYDLYVRGGEFQKRRRVFEGAVFRMQRAHPLRFFMTICNTGSKNSPYGNGGVRYDDIYMSVGTNLLSPVHVKHQ